MNIHWILAGVVIAFALTSVAGEKSLRRRLTDYRPTQIFAVGAGIILAPANIRAALGGFSPTLESITIAVTCAAIVGIMLTYALHTIRKSQAPQPRRILAIGAHPDDLELAAGGTLARLADSGHEINAIVMSTGTDGGDPKVRINEAKEGAAFLGIRDCTVYDFEDTNLEGDMTGMIKAIENKIRSSNPDIIFTHSANDQHQGHHAVHLATLRAGRRHPAILCFESPSATSEFSPQVFVDIDDHVEVKNSAIKIHDNQKTYDNQKKKPYMTAERVSGRAHFRGDHGSNASGGPAASSKPFATTEQNS